MATFDQAQEKTAAKMSDLVMEYVSQYIARDFLEIYERTMNEDRFEFVPGEFDDKIYKKISKIIRKKTGYNKKALRYTLYLFFALICVSGIAFTATVIIIEPLRIEVLNSLSREIFSLFGLN